jgi:Na+/melibiose symporter-like transporter
MEALMTRQVRKYLYAVTISVVAVLVAYDVISGDAAPLWLALAAAILGIVAPATAITHMTPVASDIADSPEPIAGDRF